MSSRADVTDAAELGSFRAVEVAVAAWCRRAAEPATLTGPAAADELTEMAKLQRLFTARQVGLARRVEETRAFKATHRDAAGWLASTAGSSVGDANRMLRTGERLAGCP